MRKRKQNEEHLHMTLKMVRIRLSREVHNRALYQVIRVISTNDIGDLSYKNTVDEIRWLVKRYLAKFND